MLDDLTLASFAPHVGTAFKLALEPDPGLALDLYEARDLSDLRRDAGGGARPGRQAFALYFHGPLTPVLPQAIYPLEHPALSRLDIFIVPLGPDAVGMRYEAIFT